MNRPSRPANAPCDFCPYNLGLLHAFVNPCPRCMANGYAFFERLIRQSGASIDAKRPGHARPN